MDLLLIVVLSLLLAPLALFTSGASRVVVGLALILFFPGYTLIAALFPKKTSLGGIERLALSSGLSIVIVPIIGLILNYTPWGIRLSPFLIAVLPFIVITAAIARYRRRKLLPENRFEPKFRFHLSALSRYWSSHDLWDRVLAVLLVSVIAGAIGTLAYVIAVPNTGERFTEFYILGQNGQTDGYPVEFVMADDEVILVRYENNGVTQDVSETFATVTLGIVNREYEEASYRISILVDDERVDIRFNESTVANIEPINLAHEEPWENEIGFVPSHVGDSQKVEFVLYKNGELCFDDPLRLLIDVVT